MSNTLIYALVIIGVLGLFIGFEKDNISKISAPDPKKVVVILMILFFFGTALASLFR